MGNVFHALYTHSHSMLHMHSHSKATIRGNSWRSSLRTKDTLMLDPDLMSNSRDSYDLDKMKPGHKPSESQASMSSMMTDVSHVTVDSQHWQQGDQTVATSALVAR